MANNYQFQRFERVEIKGHEDGFLHSYYPARIINQGINDEYQVQYMTLNNDTGNERLTEWVHVGHIRPTPRRIMFHQYFVGTKVNVYYNGGWWKGIIDRIIADRYRVTFRHYPGNFEYYFHQLRMHQKWRRGNSSWSYSLGRGMPQMANQHRYQFQLNENVEILGHQEGLFDTYYSGTIISHRVDDEYRVRYRTLNSELHDERLMQWVDEILIRPRAPVVIFDAFGRGTNVEAYDNGGWWRARVRASYADEYAVRFPRYSGPYQYNIQDLRIHQQWEPHQNSWTFSTRRI